MKYHKPHLTYEQQLDRFTKRGLKVDDPPAAMADLRRIGYYRLSGYTYPFRQSDPAGSLRRPRRLETFETGVEWRHIAALYAFDDRLRRIVLAGIQAIEVGIGVKIAYTLGKRGALAHLQRGCLEKTACDRMLPIGSTAYDDFIDRFERQKLDAKNEDFVKHFLVQYAGEVPIWAAVEFLTMGSLVRLYSLLKVGDRSRISRDLGVADPTHLDSWLLALNTLRNRCAHNGRIWNMKAVHRPYAVKPQLVDRELHYLVGLRTDRIHFLAALTMYLLRRIEPSTRWASDFTTAIGKFPSDLPLFSLDSMGFPQAWKAEPLWRLP